VPGSHSNFSSDMAFFSDGTNDYFSLSLAPSRRERAYVFRLTESQSLLSSYLTRGGLPLTLALFAFALVLALAETMGVRGYFLSDSTRTLLLIVASSSAALIAYAEVLFFLWVRNTRGSCLDEPARKELRYHIALYYEKSLAAYLIFLLNTIVPALCIAALPGGLPKFFGEIASSGAFVELFAIQLALLGLGLIAFLVRRTHTLLKLSAGSSLNPDDEK
jgi:hypothetical protein